MPDFPVARFHALKDGEGRIVHAGDLEVALFRDGDRVYALGNTCLHTGGALGEGFVIDGCAVCPWHGWQYDLASGRRRPGIGDLGVPTYATRVEADEVVVTVPDDAMGS
ncbi:MAG: NAD(FAD)-dependent dehydrogenase [Acidimicrobiales bacterium]|nr:NAD(FAD)-dependent dehydrogenase [Acidimicrobiales bacterium]